jgi:hypothetical protein
MSTTTTTYEMLNSSLPIISNGTNGLENSTSIPFYQMNNGGNCWKCSRGIFAPLYRSVVRSYLDIHVHIKVIGNKSSEYNVIYCVSNY